MKLDGIAGRVGPLILQHYSGGVIPSNLLRVGNGVTWELFPNLKLEAVFILVETGGRVWFANHYEVRTLVREKFDTIYELHRKSHNFPRPLLRTQEFGERELGIDSSYQGAMLLTHIFEFQRHREEYRRPFSGAFYPIKLPPAAEFNNLDHLCSRIIEKEEMYLLIEFRHIDIPCKNRLWGSLSSKSGLLLEGKMGKRISLTTYSGRSELHRRSDLVEISMDGCGSSLSCPKDCLF
ncbi:hypothetical protein Tco_1238545 [Tanacetum coccineum]